MGNLPQIGVKQIFETTTEKRMNIDLKSQHLSAEYGLELLLCANDLPILLFSGLIQKFQSDVKGP